MPTLGHFYQYRMVLAQTVINEIFFTYNTVKMLGLTFSRRSYSLGAYAAIVMFLKMRLPLKRAALRAL